MHVKSNALLAVAQGLKQLSNEQLGRVATYEGEFLLDGFIAHFDEYGVPHDF